MNPLKAASHFCAGILCLYFGLGPHAFFLVHRLRNNCPLLPVTTADSDADGRPRAISVSCTFCKFCKDGRASTAKQVPLDSHEGFWLKRTEFPHTQCQFRSTVPLNPFQLVETSKKPGFCS